MALVLSCALVLGVLAHLTMGQLATGGYRIPEDAATRSLQPRLWPAVLGAVLGGYVAWQIGDLAAWAALPAYLLLAWLTVPLIWIDLDVHRLPFGLVLPATLGMIVLLAIASVAAGGSRWWVAAVSGAGLWAVFMVLSWVPGGVGGGDVMLAPLLGMALGWLGPAYVLVGLVSTVVIGGMYAAVLLATRRIGRTDPVAYGPAMCLGALAAIGITSQIMASLLGR